MDVIVMKFIRTSRGLTVREFAKRIGVSAALISRIEGGERRLTFNVQNRISDTFGITDEKLLAIRELVAVIKN